MRALLWKEFYDKRIWGMVWAASIILPFCRTVNFCGYGDSFSYWLLLPLLLSLVVGAAAYSTELKGNRIEFLYTQPIPWTKQLLAKAMFGFVVAYGSVILAAVIFRAFCPDYYSTFVTPAGLAEVVGSIGWWLWTLYLCGLVYSVVLPGVEGGLIVFFACILPIILLANILSSYVPADVRRLVNVGAIQPIFIGPAIAGLLMLKFGISLPQKSRVIRYSLVILAVYVTVPTIAFIVPKDAFVSAFCKSQFCKNGINWSSVSPQGDYALTNYRWRLEERIGILVNDIDLRQGYYLVRLSDGKAQPVDLNMSHCQVCAWVNDDTAYCCLEGFPGIRVIRLTPRGTTILSWIKLDSMPTQILPSADGSAAIIVAQGTGICILDTKTDKMLVPSIGESAACWWQSSNQVGYLDSHGARRILNLPRRQRDDNLISQ